VEFVAVFDATNSTKVPDSAFDTAISKRIDIARLASLLGLTIKSAKTMLALSAFTFRLLKDKLKLEL